LREEVEEGRSEEEAVTAVVSQAVAFLYLFATVRGQM
jgi:hypothetical protein